MPILPMSSPQIMVTANSVAPAQIYSLDTWAKSVGVAKVRMGGAGTVTIYGLHTPTDPDPSVLVVLTADDDGWLPLMPYMAAVCDSGSPVVEITHGIA